MRKVHLQDHDPNWANAFHSEFKRLKSVMGATLIQAHHIGSTAIPGIKAKPVIDMVVETDSLEAIDAFNEDLQTLGYVAEGEYGIKNRRFFHKGGDLRTHHLHVFKKGNPEIQRHVNFVQYLNAHLEQARAYEALKLELSLKFKNRPQAYAEAKTEFIKGIDRVASVWKDADE